MYYVVYLTKENEIEVEDYCSLVAAMVRHLEIKNDCYGGVVVDEKELGRGCAVIETIKKSV